MGLLTDSFGKLKFPGKSDTGDNRKPEVITWSGNISLKTPIDECNFVVFDTELTGLNIKTDYIVSIGALKMTGGRIHASKKLYTLVKPPCKMKKDNVIIHRITPDELTDESTIEEVLPDFLGFISDAVLIGHFVHLDINFMNKFIKRIYKKKLKNPALDTHSIHEWLLENDSGFKRHYEGGSLKTDLFSLAKRYSIDVEEAHNSLIDSYITAQLFQRFIHFLKENGITTLKSLLSIGKA